MPANEKDLESAAEYMINEADEDMSAEDLTRGTEVYEEVDGEVEDVYEDDPEELDLEPEDYYTGGGLNYDATADAYVGEDEF